MDKKEEKRKLPILKMVVDPNAKEMDGVSYTALVDEPAIMREWMMFGKEKKTEYKFQTASAEKRIISGPMMIPDLPIYRRDISMISEENPNGEFYVYFDAQTIETIRDKFCRNGFYHNVNMMHDPNKKVGGVYLIDSFLIGGDLGVQPPKGFDDLPKGSWFASFKVDNDEIWNEYIKTGVLKGYSVEGLFGVRYEEAKPRNQIEDIVDAIMSGVEQFQAAANQ